MNIATNLDLKCIRVPLQATDKTGAITELVDVLHDAGHLTDRDAVLRAVLDRESTRSTGIGLGLAVPHGKSSACKELAMAIGKPSTPLDFDAVDGRPCSLIVLLTSPIDKTGPHIQALAGVSRLWQNESFRLSVLNSDTAETLLESIQTHCM